jgi:hypothetical protein
MSTIVHISWLNPSQSVDLYPTVLNGMQIQRRLINPRAEYFFLATAEEAQELKMRMEKLIPKKSYTVLDADGKPVGDVVTEPEIAILDNSNADSLAKEEPR